MDRVASDHRVADEHVFHGMRVADRRHHAASQIRFAEVVGAGRSLDLVFDDRAAVDFQRTVGYVDPTAPPVSDLVHERWHAGQRRDEIPRNGSVLQGQGLGFANAATVGIDTAAIGEDPMDAVARDCGATDLRHLPRRLGATDRKDSTSRNSGRGEGVAADHAVIHVDDVRVDAASEDTRVSRPGRNRRVPPGVIVVERAVLEFGDSPDGNPGTAGARRELPIFVVRIRRRQLFGNAPTASDRHIDQDQVASDGQDPRRIRLAAGPGDGDAGGKGRGVDDDRLSSVERRAAVVPLEVADQVRYGTAWLFPHAHHLALEHGVRVPDDGQFDDAAIETLIEDDRLTTGRGGKRGAKRDHLLRWLRQVFETVDYDGFIVDLAAADGEHSHENARE